MKLSSKEVRSLAGKISWKKRHPRKVEISVKCTRYILRKKSGESFVRVLVEVREG